MTEENIRYNGRKIKLPRPGILDGEEIYAPYGPENTQSEKSQQQEKSIKNNEK